MARDSGKVSEHIEDVAVEIDDCRDFLTESSPSEKRSRIINQIEQVARIRAEQKGCLGRWHSHADPRAGESDARYDKAQRILPNEAEIAATGNRVDNRACGPGRNPPDRPLALVESPDDYRERD